MDYDRYEVSKEHEEKSKSIFRYRGKMTSLTELTLSDNSFRLREFHTRTVLIEEAGKKTVRKIAATEEAVTFLKAITMREKANSLYFKEHFDVLCGDLEGDYIEYEYMPYESLYRKIAFELRENRHDKANELLRLYVQKVYSLKALRTYPRQFFSMVAQVGIENCKTEIECLSRGILDLVPRNILVDRSRWIVIDNEWSFDFPAPRVFVIFRAIRELAVLIQREIRMSTSAFNPAVAVFGRGVQTLYIPVDWLAYITDTHINLNRMLQWELGFERYVTGSYPEAGGRIKRRQKVRSSFPRWQFADDAGFLGKLLQVLKGVPGASKVVHFLERQSRSWRSWLT